LQISKTLDPEVVMKIFVVLATTFLTFIKSHFELLEILMRMTINVML